MVTSIFQYLSSLSADVPPTRNAGRIELCTDGDGKPICSIGNSAAVFKIRLNGRVCKLRCYTRPKRLLREIYRERFFPAELYVFTGECGEWADVVVEEWHEGVSLQCAIRRSLGDSDRMLALGRAFERLAARLLAEEWAHGDLKPENIIVADDGTMHLIDFDAMFRPGFGADDCEETGTRAFQHPEREKGLFDKSIDDYPAALIATAIYALAAGESLRNRLDDSDALLITPELAVAGCDPALDEICSVLARCGDALHYRMARMLRSPLPRLAGLRELLLFSAEGARKPESGLVLTGEGGLWGYADSRGFVIPPLYDNAFEFSEGLAAVQAGGCWHYIDTAGRTVINCCGCEAVTPFRNGVAKTVSGGRRVLIDRSGNIVGG